jgi:dipeptidyl aminopeptidase/acylaminoacyl peptidase
MVVAAKGGAARELIGMPSGTVRDFAWSPCGRRMAFSFRATPHERTDAGRREREERGLSTPPWGVDDVWYRLDGDGYFGAERFALWVLDIARATVECVYDRDTLGTFTYDWSPDGEALVVAANEDPRASWNHASDLLVVPVGRRGQRRASRIVGLPEACASRMPARSGTRRCTAVGTSTCSCTTSRHGRRGASPRDPTCASWRRR